MSGSKCEVRKSTCDFRTSGGGVSYIETHHHHDTFAFAASRRRAAFCGVLVLIGLLFVQLRAAAELEARTSDGRVVLLSEDGTWKFQSSSPAPDLGTATLEIQAGLVFDTGPRPVARETFYLLDISL